MWFKERPRRPWNLIARGDDHAEGKCGPRAGPGRGARVSLQLRLGGGSCSPLALAAEPAAPEAAAEPAGPQAEGSAQAAGPGDEGGTAAVAVDGDGEKPLVTIETGAAKRVEGQASTWAFPDLVMESSDPGALIRSVTVQFTSAIDPGKDAVLVEDDADNGFEVLPASKDGTAVVNNAGGATAAQWQSYLREHSSLRLADASGAKTLRMVASFKTQDTIYDYNAENGHYYEVVSTPTAWDDAVRQASQKTHLGLQGYLVTITSQQEHDFAYSLVGATCWLGATCDPAWTAPFTSEPSLAAGVGKYYWITGPEAGQCICTCTFSTKSSVAEPGMFMNWSRSPYQAQPDCWQGTELYMQMQMSFAGMWNDYPKANKFPYVIEYGGMPDDLESSVGTDVAVKVELTVDPSGMTLHTSAADIAVGDPVRVIDTVNGGPVTTAGPDGSERPAEVTHTFYVRDPGDPGADADGWRPLRDDERGPGGGPAHAGEYRVVSESVRSHGADGSPVPYEPGSDTFRVLPREIDPAPADPSAPALDAGDPSAAADAKGVARRSWAKVYDGTAALGASSASLADLVGAGPDVRLVWDSAAFDGPDASDARTVTLEGVRLEGADAADYDVSAALGAGGSLEVPGRILPRDLVVTASATVARGTEGEPLRDGAGRPVSYSHDLAVWPGSGRWAANMLAPRDGAVLADGTVDSILGEAALSCVKGSAALDPEAPEAGTYEVAVSFANVQGASARAIPAAEPAAACADPAPAASPAASPAPASASSAPAPADGDVRLAPLTASPAAVPVAASPLASFPAPPKVEFLGNGRWDLGNYLLELVPGRVEVSARPAPSGPKVVVDEEVRLPLDPEGEPWGKDDVLRDIEERFGGRDGYPSGDVTVTITRDGEEVDSVDPRVPGTYVVTATYTDADGNVRIVRVTYVVEAPQGAATELKRLARTGDPVSLGALAALALLSGAGALALRRRALRAR